MGSFLSFSSSFPLVSWATEKFVYLKFVFIFYFFFGYLYFLSDGADPD